MCETSGRLSSNFQTLTGNQLSKKKNPPSFKIETGRANLDFKTNSQFDDLNKLLSHNLSINRTEIVQVVTCKLLKQSAK